MILTSIYYNPTSYPDYLAHKANGVPNYIRTTDKKYTPRQDHKYLYIDDNGRYIYEEPKGTRGSQGTSAGSTTKKPLVIDATRNNAVYDDSASAALANQRRTTNAATVRGQKDANIRNQAATKTALGRDTMNSLTGGNTVALGSEDAKPMHRQPEPPKSFGQQVLDTITNWGRSAWDAVSSTVTNAVQAVGRGFEAAKNWVSNSFIGRWARTAVSAVTSAAKRIGASFSDFARGLREGYSNTEGEGGRAYNIGRGIGNAGRVAVDSTRGFVNGATGNLEYGPKNSDDYYRAQGYAYENVNPYMRPVVNAVNTVGNAISPVTNAIGGAFDSAGNAIRGFQNGYNGNVEYGPQNPDSYYTGQGAGYQARQMVDAAGNLINDAGNAINTGVVQPIGEFVDNTFGQGATDRRNQGYAQAIANNPLTSAVIKSGMMSEAAVNNMINDVAAGNISYDQAMAQINTMMRWAGQ